ncbi:bifunctional riboflavin kinase/FAD synthetase [Hydrogenimonas sp. SS33]|uniref:bifunctional riboflavin kinase/FAD synthetase n=1 Tax=Hydrogenimonas leucolamina TaxID=2954236 RepID=UPI00336BAFC6
MSTVESVAIGNFDGMHLGHRALFEKLGENGAVAVVEHYRATLTPGLYRAKFADRPLHYYDFDKIRGLRAADFVALLREDFPMLRTIVVGEDFAFGAGREGSVETLRSLFEGDVIAVEEVKLEGEGIHSRTIRKTVASGDMRKAAAMLGRPYEVWGEVVRGQGIGARSLVPTLNLECGRFLLPAAGVYKSETCLDGDCFASVTFVGHRETTDGRFAVETHLIDRTLSENEVPWKVSVRWLEKIRENRRFGSLEALKAQIEKDIGAARGR